MPGSVNRVSTWKWQYNPDRCNGNFERKKQDTIMFKGSYKLGSVDNCSNFPVSFSFSINENGHTNFSVLIDSGKLYINTPCHYIDEHKHL